MTLSIIIVNYNVPHLLEKCLLSIEKYMDVDYEVIVIDNASTDDTWKTLVPQFPKVQFVENPENIGFSKANNLAVKNAKGDYLYLLNPDTEILGAYFKELINFANNKNNFGSLGLRMEDAQGNFLPESKRNLPNLYNAFSKLFFKTHKNTSKSYYNTDVKEDEIAEVDILTGANLLIKKNVYTEIGGLDERYFMYGEDIDLCYTLRQKNYQNFYYGKYSILHYKGESTIKNKQYLDRFYGAMGIFIDKYYKKQQPLQYLILKAGLKIKKLTELLKLKA